ncbi:phage tail protein, partial [Vibrio alginolyticus]|nr:phage tail protein [Vibrio alginolyticus]
RVDRLYPEGTKAQVWWDVFTHQGENTGWTLETEVALPGKPAGPHFACPASEVADKIYIDFKHPDGLGYVNKNGDTNALTVEAMIEWRGEGETEWNQVKYERRDGTRDQLAETIEIDLGRKVRPEVRVYRITNDHKDLKYLDRIEYRRLKARLDSNTKYDDFTTIAFKIRGSNSLSRSAENKLGVVPTR